MIKQIIWIIVIGIAIYLGYNSQNKPVEPAKIQESSTQNIEKLCMDRAIEESIKMQEFLTGTKNPYLQINNEQIEQTIAGIKDKEYQECMNIWSN